MKNAPITAAARGLRAWKLAAQAEIDPTTYSRIEWGEREATCDQQLALARVLGIESEKLWSRLS